MVICQAVNFSPAIVETAWQCQTMCWRKRTVLSQRVRMIERWDWDRSIKRKRKKLKTQNVFRKTECTTGTKGELRRCYVCGWMSTRLMMNAPKLVMMDSEMVQKVGIPEIVGGRPMSRDWKFKDSKLLILHEDWAVRWTLMSNSALRKERTLGR